MSYTKLFKLNSQKHFMVGGIERPLDVLNNSKGKEVLVQLKNSRQMVGTLLAFDIHINIVLELTVRLWRVLLIIMQTRKISKTANIV